MTKLHKIIILSSIALLSSLATVQAQTSQIYVDNVEINSMENLKYLSIVVVSKGLGTKSKVIVDYGQKINWLSLGNPKIRDSEGGTVKAFNGAIEALNFFYDKGWEFIAKSQVEIGLGGEIGFVFLLQRK